MPTRFKKEIRRRLLITLVWVVIASLLRWRWYLPFWRVALGTLSLWLGALVGTFFLEIDHFFYTLVVYPHELTSQRIRRLFNQNQFREILLLLHDTREERVKLTFHSALFQAVFWVVCFFVLTSTDGLFGAGLVMAAALQLLAWELEFLLKGKEEDLRRRLFWQIKKKVSLREQKAFVIIMLIFFFCLNLLLI